MDISNGNSTSGITNILLTLTEMGNLILLDNLNVSLWESFSNPTDTIVIRQCLPVGTLLSSAVLDLDLSTSDYMLTITASNAILQWHKYTYWKLLMATDAYKISDYMEEYMTINKIGLYLFGCNGIVIDYQVLNLCM